MKFIIHEPTTDTVKIESIVIDSIDGYAKIPKTIGTAKGDIIVFKGEGNPVRLPVGADGTWLVADSSAPTGLRWYSPVDPWGASESGTVNDNPTGGSTSDGQTNEVSGNDSPTEESTTNDSPTDDPTVNDSTADNSPESGTNPQSSGTNDSTADESPE